MHRINSDMIIWIYNWLADGRLRVLVEGQYSGWRSVTAEFHKDLCRDC